MIALDLHRRNRNTASKLAGRHGPALFLLFGFGFLLLRLLGFGVLHRDLDRAGGDVRALPGVEAERDLCRAVYRFVGDPDRAVDEGASTEAGERKRLLDRLDPFFGGKDDFHLGRDAFGES